MGKGEPPVSKLHLAPRSAFCSLSYSFESSLHIFDQGWGAEEKEKAKGEYQAQKQLPGTPPIDPLHQPKLYSGQHLSSWACGILGTRR